HAALPILPRGERARKLGSARRGVSRRRAGLAATARPGREAEPRELRLMPSTDGLRAVPRRAGVLQGEPARPLLRRRRGLGAEPAVVPGVSRGQSARRPRMIVTTRAQGWSRPAPGRPPMLLLCA